MDQITVLENWTIKVLRPSFGSKDYIISYDIISNNGEEYAKTLIPANKLSYDSSEDLFTNERTHQRYKLGHCHPLYCNIEVGLISLLKSVCGPKEEIQGS